jgi:hypothetical protein
MDLRVLNVCLLLGWLMVTAGGIIVHPGWGIVGGGLTLIVLTVVMAIMGGVFQPRPKPARGAADAQVEAD